MTENDRIRILRKELHLTLTEFSNKLGITHAALSNIENGKRNVTEQMRKSICREFRVDPIWLSTGDGDMFINESIDLIEMLDKLLHNESKLANTLFKMFAQYSLEDWKDLERIVNKSAADGFDLLCFLRRGSAGFVRRRSGVHDPLGTRIVMLVFHSGILLLRLLFPRAGIIPCPRDRGAEQKPFVPIVDRLMGLVNG